MGDALAGRVVLVTGAGRGIGAAIARRAASDGAILAVHYRASVEGARRTLAEVREAGSEGEAFDADLTDGAAAERLVERVVDRFGRLDGLVNNAGRTQVCPYLELQAGEWDAVIATDLTAAFHTCRAALPSMLERGSGAIVNVASRLGQMGIPRTAAYSAAKAGLIGLTRSLAAEFGPSGIRVNAVAPGMIETEMVTDLAASEEGRRRLAAMPIGRFGRPEEVAETVVFLLSDAAALFLGQTLNPNGGGYMP
jgi:3-oxoacyl-[acyl-carrier protein] reductase